MPINKTGDRTGMQTWNEIFATKKNIAYQANFEHRLVSITRDFFSRRESLKLKIKAAAQEMKEIKSSTGYSLVEVSTII